MQDIEYIYFTLDRCDLYYLMCEFHVLSCMCVIRLVISALSGLLFIYDHTTGDWMGDLLNHCDAMGN